MATRNRKRLDSEQGTKHVRMFEDVADMVSWVVRVEGGSSAQLLDPMVRAQVTAKYNKHLAVIEKLRAAEDEVRRVEKEARDQVIKRKSKE